MVLTVTRPNRSNGFKVACASTSPPSLAAMSKVSAVAAKVNACAPEKSSTALGSTAVVWLMRKLALVTVAVIFGLASLALPKPAAARV